MSAMMTGIFPLTWFLIILRKREKFRPLLPSMCRSTLISGMISGAGIRAVLYIILPIPPMLPVPISMPWRQETRGISGICILLIQKVSPADARRILRRAAACWRRERTALQTPLLPGLWRRNFRRWLTGLNVILFLLRWIICGRAAGFPTAPILRRMSSV